MADKKSSNPFMDMFESFGSSMNIPAPDLSQMMDAHRKNLEALQAAAQVGSQTGQELMTKQRAALEATLSDISDAVQEAQAGMSDPQAMMTSQMEMAKRSFDATVKNSTEMSKLVQQGSTEAFDIVKARVMESIEEMQGKKKG